MPEDFAWLKPRHMIDGFHPFAEVHGNKAGGFPGSEEQVAIHYRKRRSEWGVGSQVIVYWDPQPDRDLIGTTNHAGAPVTVNGKTALYHDGTWMPGPGLDQIDVLTDGKAHWGRDFVHSIIMRTPKGIFALRAPYAVVPSLDELIRIFSSISSLS